MTTKVATSGAHRPKVVHIIDHLGWGGAERLLLQYLPYLRDAGFDVRVCALGTREGNPVGDEIRALGFPVDLVQVDHLRDLSAIPRIARYLKKVDADIVHTQLEFADAFGTLAARLRRLPTVSTLHTMTRLSRKSRAYWRNRIGDLIIGRLCRAVICVSDGARRFYLEDGRYPARALVTLRNGINLSAYPGDAGAGRAVMRGIGVPDDATVMVSVAVLRPAKGLDRAIAALSRLAERHPGLHYVIVGDGDHRKALEASAADHGVADRVHFAGARTDVPNLLAAADLFVHPTLEDALPTVLAEAGAAELPIVASEVGGVPEMVLEGRNGHLVPPDDVDALTAAIDALVGAPAELTRMGQEGSRLVKERFDLATQARALADMYRSWLEGTA